MKKEERKKIKQTIEEFEYYNNHMDKSANNDYVKATNIKKNGDVVTADITITTENSKETFYEQQYSLNQLKTFTK